jgi:hypothetical protein
MRPNFEKSSRNRAQTCPNIYIKAQFQFESQKHFLKTSFEIKNTINKPYFETAYLGENVKYLLKQKGAQKFWGTTSSFLVAQSGHPSLRCICMSKFASS